MQIPNEPTSPKRKTGSRMLLALFGCVLLAWCAAFVPMASSRGFLGEWEADLSSSRVRYEADGTLHTTNIAKPWVGRWRQTGRNTVAIYANAHAAEPFQEQTWRLRPFGLSAVVERNSQGASHRRTLHRRVHSLGDWLLALRL